MAEETCCGCVTLDEAEEYDMGLHVGAIFIIFAVSAAGTLIPIISQKIPQCKANSVIMEAVSAFAFGVVIATGLIHMVNEDIEKQSMECRGYVVENYES
ncbi:Zinc (Zn2)-Iron (Fe2) Permease (ZIP) Family, partial [Phytophthora palmivora]